MTSFSRSIAYFVLCREEALHLQYVPPTNQFWIHPDGSCKQRLVGITATEVELALPVASICNLAVSHDLKAPQQEVCVTIPRLRCRDYRSVLLGCFYKKSLLLYPPCAKVNQEQHKSLGIWGLQIPFINYGSEKEMKNWKKSPLPYVYVLYLYLDISIQPSATALSISALRGLGHLYPFPLSHALPTCLIPS